MSSKKFDDVGQKSLVLELLLPINTYWEVEQMLKHLDYMMSANEDPVLIADEMQRIYKKIAKYVVSEKDKILLQQKFMHNSGGS